VVVVTEGAVGAAVVDVAVVVAVDVDAAEDSRCDGKSGVKIATALDKGSGDLKEAPDARWERTRHTAADSHAACDTFKSSARESIRTINPRRYPQQARRSVMGKCIG